jgi:cytoskeletal protein RodZ
VESIGEQLRSAREAKGITFEQIYRDTNIPKKYLEALEAEDFAQFPGETYLLGFMRSYGDYLGLDSKELLALYKSIKIQEQPVPMEQLLRDPKPANRLPLFIAAGAAVVIVGVVLFFVFKPKTDTAVAEQKVRKPVEYALSSGILEKRYYIGDAALINLGDQKYRLEVGQITDRAILSTPAGDTAVELGQEIPLDINGDGTPDLKIFVADLVKNKSDKGVLLRIAMNGSAATESAAASATPATNSTSPAATTAVEAAPAPVVEATASSPAPANAPVLLSSPNPYPFTLQATFKGNCLLRWESDRKDRDERYFQKADILNVQAQNGIRIWLSNASAVKFQVIGGGKTVDVDLGGPGEVVVTDLKWVKDDDGRYKLTTVRLD